MKQVLSNVFIYGLILVVACTSINARQSRSNNFQTFTAGDSIEEKDDFNPFGFLTGDKQKNQILNKQILKLKQQEAISKDELVQSIVEGIVRVVSLFVNYQAFKNIASALGTVAQSIGGILKQEKPGDQSTLHPCVLKFLTPNVTLNPFELEILQVILLIKLVLLQIEFIDR